MKRSLALVAAAALLAGCHEGTLSIDAATTKNPLDFGKVLVGDTKSMPATWFNNGKQATEVDSVKIQPGPVFSSSSPLPAGGSVAVGKKLAIQVAFQPAAAGPVAGTAKPGSLVWSHQPPGMRPDVDTLNLKGVGVMNMEEGTGIGMSGGVAHIEDIPLQFGEVWLGDTSDPPVKLAIVNRTNADISVVPYWAGNDGSFLIKAPNGTFTVKKNDGAYVDIVFSPKKKGKNQATLILRNAADPTNRVGAVCAGEGKGE